MCICIMISDLHSNTTPHCSPEPSSSMVVSVKQSQTLKSSSYSGFLLRFVYWACCESFLYECVQVLMEHSIGRMMWEVKVDLSNFVSVCVHACCYMWSKDCWGPRYGNGTSIDCFLRKGDLWHRFGWKVKGYRLPVSHWIPIVWDHNSCS